ncbi:MAG: DUF512 domain-containing protein, partial [Oscillospiraceae bacterium]
VGLLRLLQVEFMSEFENWDEECSKIPFSLATGVSAAPFLEKLLMTAAEKYDIINGKVFPIVNDFFGHTINVAGLITGGDLIAQLKNKPLGEKLLISQSMLRDGEGVFLDDITTEQVEQALNVRVVPIAQDGAALFRAFAGK